MIERTPSESHAGELLFLFGVSVCSWFMADLRFSFTSEFGPASLPALTSFSADKPFQYRILLPWIAGFLGKLGFSPFDSLPGTFRALETASIFLVTLAFRHLLSLFFPSRITSSLLALSILFVLPFHFLLPRINAFYYPSDMPSVFFSALALALLCRRQWTLYYPLFVLATLNRETSCFLTITYALTALGREKWGRILLHCSAQFLLWSAIKAVLFKVFSGNPGPDGFEWHHAGTTVSHLSTNISFLLDPGNWPFLFSMFGFTWIPVLCGYRLIGADVLKRAVLVIFPFFAGMMLVSNIYELRIFGELVPIFLAAALVIARELLAGDPRCT